MKRIFFIVCMIMVTISSAKKWDAMYISKLIASGGIDKVIEYYKGKYYGENRDPQDAFRIAELYVKKKEYATAMEWYDKEGQLINTSKVNLFNYANTNRLMGEYQKALDGYLMYAALTGDVNKVMDLANQCEKILKSSGLSYNYKLENYTYNTSADETNMAVLRTNPVYVTIKNANSKDEKPSYEISQIVRDFQNFAEPVKAYNNNIPKLIITSLSYTQDGNFVVFSVRDEKSASKKGKIKNEKLYTADNLGGNFLNVKPFPFNIEGYCLKDPSFNTDGTAIYFSSNQAGGFGGFDIWGCDLIKGKWAAPKNLGKLLNSTADEVTPFVCQDKINNTLYFSSNRDGGFGGFDIYTAKKINNTWQAVELQTAPINSAGDDVSVIYDDEIKTGYVSSNRLDGKGGFDVYRFTPFNLKLIVNTNDTFSEKVIDYALVQVFDGNDKIFEGVTDETGKAIFQINKDKNYTLKISKDNFRPVTQKINSIGKVSGDSVTTTVSLKADAQFSISKGATNNLSLDNYIIFTGRVTDAATNKPAYTAKMRMVNYTTQRLRVLDIDSTGRFEIKLLLNNSYKIIFENQESKITDELTTYGLEKNSVKVRDYQLSGSKFKLIENKVYKPDNIPTDINLKFVNKNTSATSSAYLVSEPITQTKIDSLKQAISINNPQVAQVSKQKYTISAPEIKQEAPKVIAETKVEQTPKVKEDIKVEIKTETKVENTITVVEAPKTEKSDTTIVVGPADSKVVVEPKAEEPTVEKQEIPVEKTVPVITVPEVKKEATVVAKEDGPQLAADMVSTKKVKKVKSAAEENKKAETIVVQTAEKVDTIVAEKVIVETPKPEAVVEITKEKVIVETAKPEVVVDVPKEKIVVEVPKETVVVETPKVVEPKKPEVKETVETKTDIVNVETTPVEKTPVVETSTPQKITPEPIVEEKKPIAPAENILPDLYYKVQLDSYDTGNIKFPEFEYLGKIEEVKAYGRYIYRLGNFDNLERAKEILDLVRTKGYFVAFILQYNKDKVTGIVK